MLIEFHRMQHQPRDGEIPRSMSADRYRGLLEDVQLHTGLARRGEAARVVQTVIAALGEAILESDRQDLVAMLPRSVAEALQSRPAGRARDADGLYRSVASAMGIGLSPALEYTQAVCQGLGRVLDRGSVKALRSRLPEELAELFAASPETRNPPPRRPLRPSRPEEMPAAQTLAAGRPVSRRPMSEAVPSHLEEERGVSGDR